MSLTSDINIRIATLNDHDIVLKGFRDFYIAYEPLTIGFIEKCPITTREEQLYMSLLNKNLSLIAMKGDRLVGFILNTEFNPNTLDEIISHFGEEYYLNKKRIYIDRLLREMNEKVNIYELYEIGKTFELCCLGVDPEFRGQSIGKSLFQKSFEIAKLNDFQIAVVDCSSKYSAIIAERLGMGFITSVKYSEFKNNDGIPVFQPPEEHTHIKRYIKIL